MPLTLAPLEAADLATCTDIFVAACQQPWAEDTSVGGAYMATAFPHYATTGRPRLHAAIASSFAATPPAQRLKVCDPASAAPTAPVAFLLWDAVPAPPPLPPPFVDNDPAEDRTAACTRMMRTAAAHVNHAGFARGPTACLSLLMVHPAYQGRGVGRLCMDYFVAEADARGWRAQVESSTFARRFYMRWGFAGELLARPRPPDYEGTPPPMYAFMCREVAKAG